MAKMTAGFGFTGTIGNLTAYQMRGSEAIIIRSKGGASKKKILTSPQFVNTRRNNSEFGGCSRAAKWIRFALNHHQHLADHNLAASFTKLARHCLDHTSEWGKRNVQLSQYPQLLEGYNFSRRTAFDSVLRTPVQCLLSKENLSASFQIPELVPGINLFTQNYPMFSLCLTIGIVPDLYYDKFGYKPVEGYVENTVKEISTPWQSTSQRMTATVIELTLQETPPDQNFLLLAAIGINYGKMESATEIRKVKYVGAGKILRVV